VSAADLILPPPAEGSKEYFLRLQEHELGIDGVDLERRRPAAARGRNRQSQSTVEVFPMVVPLWRFRKIGCEARG